MICFSAKAFLNLSGTSFLIPLHDSDVVYQKVFLVLMSLSMIGETTSKLTLKMPHTGNLKDRYWRQPRHGNNART